MAVGGDRLVVGITRSTSVDGTGTRTTMGTLVGSIARRLGTNKAMTLAKFNAFRIGRHTTQAKQGPRAKRGVRVTTTGVPKFGTNGKLGSSIG